MKENHGRAILRGLFCKPMIEENIPLVNQILEPFTPSLRGDFPGYRNHVYRMINFCLVQGDFVEEEKRKIMIAGCFHDIGIWTGDTFDYLPPSISAAIAYLVKNDLQDWSAEISLMIDQHHKLTTFRGVPLVEVFRKGDLADFSLGLLRNGIPRDHIQKVKRRFPNEGFHRMLVKCAGRWICRHPLNPVPVLKW